MATGLNGNNSNGTTTPKGRAEDRVKWLVDLSALQDAPATLETKEGVKRSGRITKVVTSSFSLGKRTMPIPVAIELNNDPGDLILFSSLKTLEVS